MSKKSTAILLCLALIVSLVVAPGQTVAKKVKLSLNKKKVTLYVGKSVRLKVKGTKKKVKWSSNKKKVAAVNAKGKVTAKKKGSAKITAKVAGKKLTCKVTVKKRGLDLPEQPEPTDEEQQPLQSAAPNPNTDVPAAPTTEPSETALPQETADTGESGSPQPSEGAVEQTSPQPTPGGNVTVTAAPTATAPSQTTVPVPTVSEGPTATPKPTTAPTAAPTATPVSTPDLSKNMATEAKVKSSASSIKASVSEEGAVAEFTKSTQYNQADYQLNIPISLKNIKSVEFTLKVTGTPDSVSFKLYDSSGEISKLTQYNKKTGTHTISITSDFKDKTVTQFSIMTNSDLSDGETQTATAVLTSLMFVPEVTSTSTPKPAATAKPTATPLPKPSLPPSDTVENGEVMTLSANTVLATGALQGNPTYNADGSVTVSAKHESGGGGIAFYIDPAKNKVDLSHYTKVIFDVSADYNMPIVLNQYEKADFWNDVTTLSYTEVSTERTKLSADLGSNEVLGLGVRYAAWNESATADPLTLTIHSITLVRDTRDISEAKAYSPLYGLAEKYGFKMGTVYNNTTVTDKLYGELMGYHFNSMTAANEMKAYSMLDQSASQAQKDEERAAINFTNADLIMDFAKTNGIKVRGHVLVWDADMNDWFFRVGFNPSNAYASQDVIKKRVKNYIDDVLTHFEEKYPGIIYCWDVVNEAVGDTAGTDYNASDPRHVRTSRSGKTNLFYDRMGSDYVELSFQYAREVLDEKKAQYPSMADIKLYYNDYSTFYQAKRDAICELVKSINSHKSDGNGGYVKLCDGVGMQSYIGGYGQQSGCMSDGDINLVKTAIGKFADLGVEVQVTELAVRNYQGDEATIKEHGEFYQKLFQAYISVNQERSDQPLKAVSIWGIVDKPDMLESDYSYRMNGPYCGLFDEKLGVKPAFEKIYDLMSGN